LSVIDKNVELVEAKAADGNSVDSENVTSKLNELRSIGE